MTITTKNTNAEPVHNLKTKSGWNNFMSALWMTIRIFGRLFKRAWRNTFFNKQGRLL